MEEEAVYIFINRSMDGFVKIGRTSAARLKKRLKELSDTAVPVPFECYYACTVRDSKYVEKRLHDAFGDHRVSPKREFFKVGANRVKAALELAAITDITPENDKEDEEEINQYIERRPPFCFSLANIPIGAELKFIKDENIVCRVVDDKQIELNGQITSLSKAAAVLLGQFGRKVTQVQGPIFWLYEGKTLDERRQRILEES